MKYQQRKAAQRAFPTMDKCEKCGSAENLQRHHSDYSKPTEVQILCQACHVKADLKDGTRRKKPMQKCEICGKMFNPLDSHQHKTCGAVCLSKLGRMNAENRWLGIKNQTSGESPTA